MGLCQSSPNVDTLTLEMEVKNMDVSMLTCKETLADYTQSSEDIKAKLRENIANLQQVNSELNTTNTKLTTRIDELNERERRINTYVKCGTTSCRELKNKQAKLVQENDLLKARLLKAEKAEKSLMELKKKEKSCVKKLKTLEKYQQTDIESIRVLVSEKKLMNIRIAMLQKELNVLSSGTPKYNKCKIEFEALSSHLRKLEGLIPGELTAEQFVQQNDARFKNWFKEKSKLEQDSKEATTKYSRARQMNQVNLRRWSTR